ncbi:MAG: hybrid sensor histidine kinase/response regulator [Sphingomonadaceae bacterium]|nr:hybrid sensor histidine kinase/response regulator [Sphingomonadaceae bacterium]
MEGGGAEVDRRREIRAQESRIEFVLAGIFTLLVAGTLYYVYDLFEPLAPSFNLAAWAWFTASVTLVMALAPIIFFVRRPDPDGIERIWSPFGKVVAILFDIAVASSVWLLLPYASEPLQLLMVIFYSAAISGQVISTAESIGTNVFAVLVIFGSAALFFLQTDSDYAISVAIFLLAFGGLMILVALILKQAIRSAISSKMDAERLSEEISIALSDAQQARDARTRFIAAASHDLRQPIQAAMLFFQQATTQKDSLLRREAEDGVRQGFAEVNALLERMMEHLRIESGAITVHPETIELASLFATLAEELAIAARQAGVEIIVKPSQAWVHADRTLLARIMRNLLHNAIIHAKCRYIELEVRPSIDDELEIRVADDGIGLAPGFASHAFEAYVQGGESAQHGLGMGLGLSVARELARLMDGELVAGNGATCGAVFTLTLPTGTVPIPGPLADPSAAEANIGGLDLLLFDDDRASCAALAGLLEHAGAHCQTAHTLDELAQCCAQDRVPHVLITDWQIGEDGTGEDVVAAGRERWPDISVIIMTGESNPLTAIRIAELGWPIFWKPVDFSALCTAISAQAQR